MPNIQSRDTRYIDLVKLDKTSSPVTETAIGGITDMPQISANKETTEDTTIGDKIRSRKVTMEDPQTFTLSVYWDPNETPQQDLQTAYDDETQDDYKVKFNDVSPAEEWEFKAIVTSYGTPYGGVGALLTQDFTFQLLENDQGEVVTHNPA